MAMGDMDNDSSLVRSNRGPNAAMVQYPASSMLHKKGPSAFLPRSFLSRVKGLVAIATEGDASEIHVRSLVLALNFAVVLEIKSNYGDVGAAFALTGEKNIVSTPLVGPEKKKKSSSSSRNSNENPPSPTSAAAAASAEKKQSPEKEEVVAVAAAAKPEDSSGFDMVDSFSSPTRANNNNNNDPSSPPAADVSQLNSFPALTKSRSDESKLIHSLELALQSYVSERTNERKTVMTVHKWFSAVRAMLAEVAESSSEQQRMLFDGLMTPAASAGSVGAPPEIGNDEAAAIARDMLNLHQACEDVGNYLTGEDILLALGEQQRLNRLDLGRFVEHYRRRAGAAVDMLCNKGNVGSRSRPANELFWDVFALPGIECYEINREVLLAQTSATVVTFAPCEGPEHTDPNRPPKPFWENVETTVSLSSRFLCLDATNQTIGSKALSGIAKLLPKGDDYYAQKMINNFYAHQVIPIAAVSRIEVIEGVVSGGILASTVIPRDMHTLRLYLSVDQSSGNSGAKKGDDSSSSNLWRAKLDLRLSQKSGVSQLLFLVVNKHHDFTQAIKRIQAPSDPSSLLSEVSSSSSAAAAAAASSSSTSKGDSSNSNTIVPSSIDPGHFVGRAKGLICPVALGPARLRDIAAITTDEVYENERNYPLVGWSKKLLPHDPPAYSDRCGIRPRTREMVDKALPQGYEWASEWCLVPYYEGKVAPATFDQEFADSLQNNNNSGKSKSAAAAAAGDDLFVYGTFWRLADFHAAPFPICSIRRRKWLRQRRLLSAAREGMSATQLQSKRDAEADAADRASASSASASSSAAHLRQQQQLISGGSGSSSSPEKDLHNSLAFASHLTSLEQLSRGGGGSQRQLDDDE